MHDVDHLAERKVDDEWTTAKLMTLGAVVLVAAMSLIWFLAKMGAPPGYH